jgi:hypothetical protein
MIITVVLMLSCLTIPGPIPDGNSYRCELTGIYGIMVLVKVICQHYHITTGSVHVRCDNKSALLVLEPWFVPEPSHDSFDIVNAIWHLLQESPISWTGEWVKAHQDDDGVLVTEQFAVLNCKMDNNGKKYRENIETAASYDAPQLSLYAEGWSVWCGTEKLHSPTYHTLYDRIYAPHIIKHWTTKTSYLQISPHIDPLSIPSVDWDAVEACMKALPTSKRRWNTKHGSENGGVGQTLFIWKLQKDNICPCCDAVKTLHMSCNALRSNPNQLGTQTLKL